MFCKSEFDLHFCSAQILKWKSEFLRRAASVTALFHDYWHNSLVPQLSHLELLLTGKGSWHLNSASKQHLESLSLRKLLALSQELFHTVVVSYLKKIFERILPAEFFISIGQQANVDDRQNVFNPSYVISWAPNYNDELLLCLGAQLQGNPFG